ncbi:MAG: hypothetical protein EBW14_11590 [Oxalobacteraceae bacterium]|nr:hypothetical protein [Oxalobacteraceae bacterium]
MLARAICTRAAFAVDDGYFFTYWVCFFYANRASARWEKFWQQALPQLRSDRAQMQALASQLSVQASSAPSATGERPIDRTQLERSLSDSAIKTSSLDISEGLIRLRCSDVSFDSLNRWLQQMHREHSYVVTDVSIIARERAGQVDASVSLRSLSAKP